MVDITMCRGDNSQFEISIEIGITEPEVCPLRENCYRYLATPDEKYQSYFIGYPYENGECEYYCPILDIEI